MSKAIQSPSGFSITRRPEAHDSGGWAFKTKANKEEAKVQRGVIWDLVQQIGKKLTSGKIDLNGVCLPPKIFEPRSYLQRITDGWCHGPIFLRKAAETEDPIERLKNVIAFAISGLPNTCSVMKKPFNPILGETYQATYEDGTTLFCEQSSHHPPVTNWEVFGPDNLYYFYGFGEWHSGFRGTSVKGRQDGVHYVSFPDGTIITYELPSIIYKGLIYGDIVLEYDGVMEFRDKKNGFGATVTVNPPQKSGYFGFGKKKFPSDYLKGSLYRSRFEGNGDDKEDVCSIEGSWIGALFFDQEQFWSWEDDLKLYTPKRVDNPLPSDCTLREDLLALAEGDQEKAASTKVKLEQKQRMEAKLRKEGMK